MTPFPPTASIAGTSPPSFVHTLTHTQFGRPRLRPCASLSVSVCLSRACVALTRVLWALPRTTAPPARGGSAASAASVPSRAAACALRASPKVRSVDPEGRAPVRLGQTRVRRRPLVCPRAARAPTPIGVVYREGATARREATGPIFGALGARSEHLVELSLGIFDIGPGTGPRKQRRRRRSRRSRKQRRRLKSCRARTQRRRRSRCRSRKQQRRLKSCRARTQRRWRRRCRSRKKRGRLVSFASRFHFHRLAELALPSSSGGEPMLWLWKHRRDQSIRIGPGRSYGKMEVGNPKPMLTVGRAVTAVRDLLRRRRAQHTAAAQHSRVG
eukprot:scaffold4022_cov58-Phaeocystis_antarctica.AAC.3